MTKDSLVSEIRKYLAEGTPAEQEARRKDEEKRRFVSAVRDFIQTPEIVDLLKRLPNDGRHNLGLLEIEQHFPARFSYDTDVRVPVYKVYVQRHSIVVEGRSERDGRRYSFPTKLDEWMRILPYGERFSGCDEFKPEISQYLSDLERTVRNLLR